MRLNGGGNVPLGGGTKAQIEAGIQDSPYRIVDILPKQFSDCQCNDPEVVRAFADYDVAQMPAEALEVTVVRYNDFVDAGSEQDFGKPRPTYKIASPPFYAAWATPAPHDSRAGLRINGKCQVLDLNGQVSSGLYCGGESAGGFSQHGLARAVVQGLIAGKHAVLDREF